MQVATDARIIVLR